MFCSEDMSFSFKHEQLLPTNVGEKLLIASLYLQWSLITKFSYEILAELYLEDTRSPVRPLLDFLKSGFKLYNDISESLTLRYKLFAWKTLKVAHFSSAIGGRN